LRSVQAASDPEHVVKEIVRPEIELIKLFLRDRCVNDGGNATPEMDVKLLYERSKAFGVPHAAKASGGM